MHQPLSKSQIAAINGADTCVSGRTNLANHGQDRPADDRIVFDAGPQWFPNAARQLLAPKPGLVLHLQTDCGERNGHRYASGEVAVPSYVVRQLMRGPNGRQWLAALMDGCTEDWWCDMQRAAGHASEARAFAQRIVAQSGR